MMFGAHKGTALMGFRQRDYGEGVKRRGRVLDHSDALAATQRAVYPSAGHKCCGNAPGARHQTSAKSLKIPHDDCNG